MAVNIDSNNFEAGIGRLNDSFFHAEPQVPIIDSNFLSPTDEIIKKFDPFKQFIKIGHGNTVSIPKK